MRSGPHRGGKNEGGLAGRFSERQHQGLPFTPLAPRKPPFDLIHIRLRSTRQLTSTLPHENRFSPVPSLSHIGAASLLSSLTEFRRRGCTTKTIGLARLTTCLKCGAWWEGRGLGRISK